MRPGEKASLRPKRGDALVIVDMQNDFLSGGSLAVPRADEIVPTLNRYLQIFAMQELPVYATRDWHPRNHCSFREQGGPWPPHCIAGTHGAQFAASLKLPPATTIISKASGSEQDAYSGFQDTGLDDRLRAAGIQRLFIGGLATDYCVLNTVRDGLRLGYRVLLLVDAIRAVDVRPGDGVRAETEMSTRGAQTVSLEEISA